jgi:hypothetical protein
MSQIDKHNYEAWLLDAAEGRLSAAAMAELETFLAKHPEIDIQSLDALPVLEPETFAFDNNLLKDEHVCIEYVEGLLTASQQTAVENEPTLATALALYKATRLTPEASELFPDKKFLLKEPKVVLFFQPRLLRAAAAVLVIGFLIWMLPNKKVLVNTNSNLANNSPAATANPTNATPLVSAPAPEQPRQVATTTPRNEQKEVTAGNRAKTVKKGVTPPALYNPIAKTVALVSPSAMTQVAPTANTPTINAPSAPTNTAASAPTAQAPVLANNSRPVTEQKLRYTSLDDIAIDTNDDETAEPTNWNQYMTKADKVRKKNVYGRLLTFADNAIAAGKKLLHFDDRNNGYAFAVRDFKVEKH